MGRSSSTHPLEGLQLTSQANPNSIMLRFVALFVLVAVALAEPEADPQVFTYNHVAGVPVVHPVVGTYATHVVKPVVGATHVVNPVVPVVKYHVPVVKAAVPVVKYVDPHHTEGMTEGGVPEKTDSVKIAEKQHEIAQIVEKSKHKFVVPYAHTYAGYPFVHPYVASHVVAKREADSDADPYLLYSTHHAGVAHTGVYPYSSVYPYTYGYPYTTAVTGYTYPIVHPSLMKYPVVHHSVMKRKADSESQFYYSHYNTPYAYNYGYGYPYTYNNVYNTYGVYGR